MSNSDYLATAFVRIRPATQGFAAELRKQVQSQVKLVAPPKINVAPSTVGFSSALRKQVRDAIATSGIHTVKVKPVLTAFRAEFARQLNQKPIPVSVVPAGGKAGAAAGGAAQAEQTLASAQTSRKQILKDLRQAEKLLEAATREGITEKQRDVLVSRAQALARKALLDVTLRQAEGERILQQEALKARAIKVGGRAERVADAPAKAAAAAAAEKAATEQVKTADAALAAQKEALAKINDRLVVSQSAITATIKSSIAPEEALKSVTAELNVLKQTQRQIEIELQAALRTGNVARAESLRTLLTEAKTITELGAVQKANLTTQASANALSTSQAEITKKLAAASQVQVQSLSTLAAVKAESNVLSGVSRQLTSLETKAQELNAVATLEFVEAKQLEVAARKTALADQARSIKGNQAELTSQKNLRRGVFATSLTFLGARGATLAAGSSFLIGAAAATALAKSIGSFASFEQELNVFQATAEATASEMRNVQETARALGADITLPAVGASDAAAAMTNLAKAGLDVQDAMDGARGTLQLATAAGIENAEATELVASALNSFGLAGIEATRVADLLTGAANEAQGTITDMGIALQQSSAVARQAGLSLEDTVAFITLLAQNGIRGSDAGTSLRTALLRLIAPTKEANKQLRTLGITVLDAQGNVRPEVFDELQRALQGLDATARNQTLRKIFGQDAIRAAVIFGREGATGLDAVRDATQKAGLASQLATARTKGFSGAVSALKNSVETLGLNLGQLVKGPLLLLIKSLQANIDLLNKFADAIRGASFAIKEFVSPATDPVVDFGKSVLDTTQEVGRFLDEVTRGVPVVDSFFDTVDKGKEVNQGVIDALRNTRQLAREFQQVEGPDEALEFLDDLKDRLKGNSVEVEEARERIRALTDLIIGLGRVPTRLELQVFLNERRFKSQFDALKRSVSRTNFDLQFAIGEKAVRAVLAEAKAMGGDAGDTAVFTFIERFGAGLDPKVMQELLKKFFGNVPKLAPFLVRDPGTGGIQGLTGKEILGRIAGFDAERVRAELSGSTAELVGVLRSEQEFLEGQLQRDLVKKQPGLRRAIESALLGVQNDLTQIAEDEKQASEDAASKIEEANKEAATKLISVFTGNERKLLNQQVLAAQTEGLKDDIKASTALVALYEKQKIEARKKIKDAEALADFLAEINQKIFQVNVDIKNDQKTLAQKLRQEQRDARQRIIEGLQLDVELAEINENRAAEIRARRKLIEALEDQIKHEKGNTNKIKELRNEIARQKQAIKEAKEEEEGRRDEFKALLFSFLQTQQGFAANLFTNLIPGGTGGLVGGTTAGGSSGAATPLISSGPRVGRPGSGIDRTPGQQLAAQGAVAGAIAGGNLAPSRGGQNRELVLLEQILITLKEIRRGGAAPEATYNKVSNNARMDFEHGHGGGG